MIAVPVDVASTADALGASTANPMRLDSRPGLVETSRTRAVPDRVGRTFVVDLSGGACAGGGVAEGRISALELAPGRPGGHSAVIDVSGREGSTRGSRRPVVGIAIAGDESRFIKVNPLDELAKKRGLRS
jgi:hypothetical protein